MTDYAKVISSKFVAANRYANFGPCIRQIHVKGFRGVSDLTLPVEFPIMAFSGLNGAGKTTVAQLLACAYKAPSTAVGYKRFYVKDFFPFSVVDPSPFGLDAAVRYQFETNSANSPQDVTISRKQSEWSGYKRQPERFCYYVGFTLYIPKVERKDLSIYRSATLELRQTRTIPAKIQQQVSALLGQPYESAHFQTVGHGGKEAELGMLQKFGTAYSENNMGFGEGRVLYMVDLLENSPEQSLFVLEEPETSLHEDAQRRLSRYLLDVVNRRRHQIFITTHSAALLRTLPPQARTLLYRDATGVSSYPGISAAQVRALLTGGTERGVTVCVEDVFAQALLTEIVRRGDPMLLKAIRIVPIGDTRAVAIAVSLLRRAGQAAVGLRDGDIGADPANGLYSLPGTMPPEKEVLTKPYIQSSISSDFQVDCESLLTIHSSSDHHLWPQLLAAEASVPEEVIVNAACKTFVQSLDEAEIGKVVNSVKGGFPN